MLFSSFSVCKMNVHKRCQKNVANNCGINTRDMAQILQEMGITTDKLTQKGRKKVGHILTNRYPLNIFHIYITSDYYCCIRRLVNVPKFRTHYNVFQNFFHLNFPFYTPPHDSGGILWFYVGPHCVHQSVYHLFICHTFIFLSVIIPLSVVHPSVSIFVS